MGSPGLTVVFRRWKREADATADPTDADRELVAAALADDAADAGNRRHRRADRMTRVDLDQLAELEEERRFLLRSLADLEREHDAGDIDDADYATLRDGYTVRAAAVLREIDGGRAQLPPKPTAPLGANHRDRAAVVAGVGRHRVRPRRGVG